MATIAGSYYGESFKGFRGVTQGDSLSPTIFNVVVDVVVRHWVYEMVDSVGGQGGRRREGRHQSSIFYMDDSIIASSDLGWLQGAFSTLVGMFDWLGLSKNAGKTAGMVCRPCQAEGTQLETA